MIYIIHYVNVYDTCIYDTGVSHSTSFTDQSSTDLSGYSTVDTSKTKPVKKSIAEVGQTITLQQQSFRPSAGNIVI